MCMNARCAGVTGLLRPAMQHTNIGPRPSGSVDCERQLEEYRRPSMFLILEGTPALPDDALLRNRSCLHGQNCQTANTNINGVGVFSAYPVN